MIDKSSPSAPFEQMSPDEQAAACAKVMWDSDNASRTMGMEIQEVRAGFAELTMEICDHMTNGQKIAHGGIIFTLADSAFAFACNGYNQFTVAQHCSVAFLAPGKVGDILTAKASEQHRAGRSGIYDVKVTNQSGEPIAEFRGHSRTVKGQHIPT